MKIYFRFLLVFLVCLFLSACGKSSPEHLVQKELNAIQNLDQETIETFISYEDITRNQTQMPDVGEESIEAVKLFFQNFDYKIKSCDIQNETAYVTVEITNLDAKQLAKDLCLQLLCNSMNPSAQENVPLSTNDSFSILGELLKENTYESVTTEAVFELIRFEDGWSIQSNAKLQNDLVGGLISYLNDPYLLTPEENATAVLDMMKGFDSDDWVAYLDMDDIFATGSEHYQEVDQSLAEQISKFFNYSISGSSIEKEGNDAEVTVEITSLDLSSVLDSFRTRLVDYASTTKSLRDSYVEQTNHTALELIKSLDENQKSATFSTTISFHNDGSSWIMTFAKDFSSILLGGSSQAISEFSADS